MNRKNTQTNKDEACCQPYELAQKKIALGLKKVIETSSCAARCKVHKYFNVILMGGHAVPVNPNHGLGKNRAKFTNFKTEREKNQPTVAEQGIEIYLKACIIVYLLRKLLYSSARRCFTLSGSV